MSYRDDLDAAHSRADALEREVQALTVQNRGLARSGPRQPVNWRELAPALAGTLASGTFAGLAIALGWGAVWAGGGFILMVISVLALFGASSPGLPGGAVPVSHDVELAGARAPARILAVVSIAKSGEGFQRALDAFNGRAREDVAAAAAVLLEQAVRDHVADHPDALAGGLEDLPAARAALDRVGLTLQSLWVGPR